jgi:hypothetical protein
MKRLLVGAALVAAVSVVSVHAQQRGGASWPQWGGVNRDFIVANVELAEQWPET